jgi:hypothetical protein
MFKKCIFTGVVLSLVLTGCDQSNGTVSPDPVDVDLSLPAVSALPDFEGDFPATEADAFRLFKDAFGLVGQKQESMAPPDFTDLTPGASYRAVQTENINKIFRGDTTILPGASVTGFVLGTVTSSIAQEGSPTQGDYVATSLRSKMAVDFNNVTGGSLTVKGKYMVTENVNLRTEWTQVSPIPSMTYSGTVNADGGYAFSISNSGTKKGLKAVVTLQIRGINTIVLGLDMDLSALINPFTKFEVVVELYDNSNVRKHRKTYDFNVVGSLIGS